ncbi:anti-anti-sigma factor [Nonomuraea thailandensis]|uniref:Anti-anti-sigma factor n=1 Tax=Nonomuraea thailandensis TaxID=1188745 RepID=A0A9X2GHW9_9ACTN|nr:STAS domain-containing protein [Nonomuraea thailandensis]MCP2357942.1 anti-anti-sigma factor [Nonomuraea thailandensis]
MTDRTDDAADVLPMVHPFGLRVRGDIDRASRPVLARSLAWAVRISKADIHLDLSELTFIDAAGLQLVVRTAAGLRPPRALVLVNASATVRDLLTLLSWQLDPEQRLRPEGGAADPQGPDPAPAPPR